MWRCWSYVVGAALTTIAVAATLATVAQARSTADDVSVQVFLHSGKTPTTTNGLRFEIVIEAESASGAVQPVTIRTGLPSGLRWGTDGPDPGEGCTDTAPAICATKMQLNEVGTVGAGYEWDVVADRSGFYEITASVTPSEADPNLANNTHTFRSRSFSQPVAVVKEEAEETPPRPPARSSSRRRSPRPARRWSRPCG